VSPRAVPAPGPPEGLVHRDEFISPDEERRLLEQIERVEFAEVVFHGYPAKRTVAHFGVDYEYDSGAVEASGALPDWLLELRARCAALAGVESEAFVEALVTRYPPGAGIGWHRDARAFGGSVAGVSLGAACRMRFRRTKGGVTHAYDLGLAPRSAYVMSGAARWSWQHSIPAVAETRHSITFRTLRALH
jgi:alkylated DNA repair dioxygenase AlkB